MLAASCALEHHQAHPEHVQSLSLAKHMLARACAADTAWAQPPNTGSVAGQAGHCAQAKRPSVVSSSAGKHTTYWDVLRCMPAIIYLREQKNTIIVYVTIWPSKALCSDLDQHFGTGQECVCYSPLSHILVPEPLFVLISWPPSGMLTTRHKRPGRRTASLFNRYQVSVSTDVSRCQVSCCAGA